MMECRFIDSEIYTIAKLLRHIYSSSHDRGTCNAFENANDLEVYSVTLISFLGNLISYNL